MDQPFTQNNKLCFDNMGPLSCPFQGEKVGPLSYPFEGEKVHKSILKSRPHQTIQMKV
jgi:hypothetical protein